MYSRWLRGGLLRRTYYLKEQQTKYVSIYLNDDNLKPEVKIGTPSGHAVLNEMQWFILVTFKSDMAKNEVYEIGDPHYIPCQCTVDGISASQVRTLKCF